MNDTAAKTHVRITDGGTEFITWPEARDEVHAAMTGETAEQVREMSVSGEDARIEYTDGRKVEIREATDADRATEPEQMWATARSSVDLYHAMDSGNRARCNRGIHARVGGEMLTRAQVAQVQQQYAWVTLCPKCLDKLA